LARNRHGLFGPRNRTRGSSQALRRKIIAVGLRIGDLQPHPDELMFAFETLTRETPWENLKVEIEWCPRRQKCQACGEEFTVAGFEMACPKCGECRSTCISGTELDIAYLELEEPCARP
jgi:hydrogenase nickel incorporation protein HypA/HybF